MVVLYIHQTGDSIYYGRGYTSQVTSIKNTNGIIAQVGDKFTNFNGNQKTTTTPDSFASVILDIGVSFEGKIYEILAFDKALNNSEQLSVINYLQGKWGDSILTLSSSNDKFNKVNYNNEVIGIHQTSSTDKFTDTNAFVGGLRIKDTDFLKDDDDSIFIGRVTIPSASLFLKHRWYMDINDENSNGGKSELIFNLADLGLAGQIPSLQYSADDTNWEKCFCKNY